MGQVLSGVGRKDYGFYLVIEIVVNNFGFPLIFPLDKKDKIFYF